MNNNLELGKLRMNRERGIFLLLAALCAWQVISYYVYKPEQLVIGDPYVKASSPEGELFALAEHQSIEEILSVQGYDVFVPRDMLQSRVAKVATPVPVRSDGRIRRTSKRKNRVTKAEMDRFAAGIGASGHFADDVPPLPMAASQNRRGPVRVPINEEYLFPLKISGWIMPGKGEDLKVMVTPAAGGESFCLRTGEEWGDVRVKTLTPEMVEFINQEGKIIYIDKETLLREKRTAAAEGEEDSKESNDGEATGKKESSVIDTILEKLNLSKDESSILDKIESEEDLFKTLPR